MLFDRHPHPCLYLTLYCSRRTINRRMLELPGTGETTGHRREGGGGGQGIAVTGPCGQARGNAKDNQPTSLGAVEMQPEDRSQHTIFFSHPISFAALEHVLLSAGERLKACCTRRRRTYLPSLKRHSTERLSYTRKTAPACRGGGGSRDTIAQRSGRKFNSLIHDISLISHPSLLSKTRRFLSRTVNNTPVRQDGVETLLE